LQALVADRNKNESGSRIARTLRFCNHRKYLLSYLRGCKGGRR